MDTVLTAAKTKEVLEEEARNPEVKPGGEAGQGQYIYLTLKVTGGTPIKPVEVYEALDTKFGTVASVKNDQSRDTYVWAITA